MRHLARGARFVRLFFPLLGLLFILPACAPLPLVEVKSYQEAFNLAKVASEEVIFEFANTKKQVQEIIRKKKSKGKPPPPPGPFPASFDPKNVLPVSNVDPDVQARLQAWEVISRYNDVLITLAEGKSVEQVGASFDALANSVKTLVGIAGGAMPGFGAVTAIAKQFLELAEKFRIQEEFKRILPKGREVVVKIIDSFLADTKEFYRLRGTVADENINLALLAAGTQADTMVRLAKEFKEPTQADLIKQKKKVQGRFVNAMVGMGFADDKANLAGNPASAKPYTELVQSQLVQVVEAVEAEGKRYDAAVQEMLKYRELLKTYASLLFQVKDRLAEVQKALDKPASPKEVQDNVREFFRVAISLRRSFQELRK